MKAIFSSRTQFICQNSFYLRFSSPYEGSTELMICDWIVKLFLTYYLFSLFDSSLFYLIYNNKTLRAGHPQQRCQAPFFWELGEGQLRGRAIEGQGNGGANQPFFLVGGGGGGAYSWTLGHSPLYIGQCTCSLCLVVSCFSIKLS